MGATENKMIGWHHQLNGHEFEQTLGDSKGQGSLACCSHKESDTTQQPNNNNLLRSQVGGAKSGRTGTTGILNLNCVDDLNKKSLVQTHIYGNTNTGFSNELDSRNIIVYFCFSFFKVSFPGIVIKE